MCAFKMSIKNFLVFVSILININAAPSSSSSIKKHYPHILYDQKQTGDLNILVHLKDFQFISVLGSDDLFNDDYDYAYDENDFTVNPTRKTTTTTTTSTTSKPSTTISTVVPSKFTASTSPPSLPSSSASPSTTHRTNHQTDNKPPKLNLINKTSEEVSNTPSTPTIAATGPNKIQVHILGSPSAAPDGDLSPAIGIVSNDDDDDSGSGSILAGEELFRKKCADGFSRDKKGRCRRVRKPGLSFASPQVAQSQLLSKLTSNLAAKLRLKNAAVAPVNDDVSLLSDGKLSK